MITVSIYGMDHYEAITRTKVLHKLLVSAYEIEDNELEFQSFDSFIIHDGFEQTSFRLNLKVEAPFEYSDKEEKVKDIIFDALKDVSVHIRVNFSYFESEHEYIKLDDDYPEYMNDHNTVKAEDEEEHHHHHEDDYSDEEIYDEPYMGDIISEFDEYIKTHPEASNEEVYAALTGIRERVTDAHHEADNEDDFDEEEET